MDSAMTIVRRYRANQTCREFLAEMMGTFILMVTNFILAFWRSTLIEFEINWRDLTLSNECTSLSNRPQISPFSSQLRLLEWWEGRYDSVFEGCCTTEGKWRIASQLRKETSDRLRSKDHSLPSCWSVKLISKFLIRASSLTGNCI